MTTSGILCNATVAGLSDPCMTAFLAANTTYILTVDTTLTTAGQHDLKVDFGDAMTTFLTLGAAAVTIAALASGQAYYSFTANAPTASLHTVSLTSLASNMSWALYSNDQFTTVVQTRNNGVTP